MGTKGLSLHSSEEEWIFSVSGRIGGKREESETAQGGVKYPGKKAK